jgi:hypothetical protein
MFSAGCDSAERGSADVIALSRFGGLRALRDRIAQ